MFEKESCHGADFFLNAQISEAIQTAAMNNLNVRCYIKVPK